MRYVLILIMLILTRFLLYAQESETKVIQLYELNSPAEYAANFITNWSPDSQFVALKFTQRDSEKNFSVWKVYETKTGQLVNQSKDFIGWYNDSRRALVRPLNESSPKIIDITNGSVLGILENSGTDFSPLPIDNLILNLNEDKTLRIYDAETGDIRLTLENAVGFPIFSPDMARFVVSIIDSEVQVYRSHDLSLEHRLTGFEVEKRSNFELLRDPHTDWSPNSQQLVILSVESLHHQLGPRHIWTIGEGLSEPIYNTTGDFHWSPDGTRVAVPSDYTKIRVYNATTGTLLNTLRGFDNVSAYILDFYDNFVIVANGSNRVGGMDFTIWDFSQEKIALREYVDLVYEFWFEEDNLILYDMTRGFMRISLDTYEIVETMDYDHWGYLPQLSPDHRWVLGWGNEVLVMYRVDPPMFITKISGSNISWSPGSQFLATFDDLGIKMWQIIESE